MSWDKLGSHRYRWYKAGLMSSLTKPGMRVLEIGCGLKHYQTVCKGEYLGVDISFTPDVYAHAVWLPFRSGVFDVVVAFDVIEHVDELDRALAECARVTKAGGRLVLTTPNTLGLGIYDSIVDRTHKHHFTWKSLEKRLKTNGFHKTVKITQHLHYLWPFKHLMSKQLTAIQQSICMVAVKP